MGSTKGALSQLRGAARRLSEGPLSIYKTMPRQKYVLKRWRYYLRPVISIAHFLPRVVPKITPVFHQSGTSNDGKPARSRCTAKVENPR
jgi:hypothetical protein